MVVNLRLPRISLFRLPVISKPESNCGPQLRCNHTAHQSVHSDWEGVLAHSNKPGSGWQRNLLSAEHMCPEDLVTVPVSYTAPVAAADTGIAGTDTAVLQQLLYSLSYHQHHIPLR